MAKIYHANLYGLCQQKSQVLLEHDIKKTDWSLITLQKPFYLLIPQNTDLLTEYEEGWKITEVFPVNSVGVVTGQDSKTIAFTQNQAKILANNHKLSEKTVVPILYRPFDQRFIVYDSKVVTRSRGEVMRHMLKENNLSLSFHRREELGIPYCHFLATNYLTEHGLLSSKTTNYQAPLYLYHETNKLKKSILKEQKYPNLSQDFLNAITSKLGYTPTPEAIFYYIYAIFHSPTYRTCYAECLKIDFPRVPLTSNDQLFRQLATYGEQLVALHLMKSSKLNNTITQFVQNGGSCIVDAGHPKFNCHSERSEESRAFASQCYAQDDVIGDVVINKKGDKFIGVPENVWNFYVGGYQVCQKWLKDRKGRILSDEDIQHYQRIVVALKETIELMTKIDATIPSFPIV